MSSLPAGPPVLQPLPSHAQLSPRVFTVLGQNPGVMTLQGTNTYIIGTGKSRILLDTGEGMPAYLPLLQAAMRQYGCEEFSHILLSHWHPDHSGGLADVRPLLNARGSVYKGQGSALMPHAVLSRNPGLRESLRPIVDGDRFEAEGATLTAMATPGHTEDHMCFWLQEEKAVFSGDTILGAGTAVFTDLHSYMRSLRTILTRSPHRIYPAHGPLIDGPDAPSRIEQYLEHRAQREQQIIDALRKRRTELEAKPQSERDAQQMQTVDIVSALYVDVSPSVLPAATTNVLLHLSKLEKEGIVQALPAPADAKQDAHTHAQTQATVKRMTTSMGATVTDDDCASEVAASMMAAAARAHWRWKLLKP